MQTHMQVRTHTHTHTIAVPRDCEEPPGLSHASCFHCMAQKQRRETNRQVSKRKEKKDERASQETYEK